MSSVRWLSGVAWMLAVSACHGPATWGDTDVACRPLTVTHASRPAPWQGTIFVIVMENHSADQIVGNASAPTFQALLAMGALAAGYHDPYVHPSEPNYLWMVAGENFGVLSDTDPGFFNHIPATGHLADQIEHAGLTWRSYQQSMGAPCGIASSGVYAAKHDPFVFFDDVNGWNGSSLEPGPRCREHVVDASELASDLQSGNMPDYAFITPDLEHDMHDGTIDQADSWLAGTLPGILASSAYTRGGAIFVLADEGANEGDDPPFIVASPYARPDYVSHVSYDTSSFLLTVQKMLGLDALPCAAQPAAVHSMDDLFTVPL